MLLLLLLVACSPLSSMAEGDAQGAWLLSSKAALSAYGVETMDYVVQYGLYNVGDRPATKITLDERNSFPAEYFETARGMLQVTVDRLNPGENITHIVVLRPLQAGLFNLTAAAVTYRPDIHSNQLRAGLTTAPGEAYIYRLSEYERRFGSKIHYFICFFIYMAPFTLGTLFLYLHSSKKYAIEEPAAVKKISKTN